MPQVYVVRVEVSDLQELDVLFESIGHRELVGELVVAGDRVALRRFARYRRSHPGPRDVLEDAQRLPLQFTWAKAAPAEFLRLASGHLIVRHEDALALTAILPVQARDGMRGRA